MSDISSLTPVDFPDIPSSMLSDDNVRQPIVKASAYITIALEEADVNHNRDQHAAAVTDMTYTLKEDCTPEEYLELAVQELAYAESEVGSDMFKVKLQHMREQIQDILD